MKTAFLRNFELSINPLSGKNLSLNECYVNVEKVNKMGNNKYVWQIVIFSSFRVIFFINPRQDASLLGVHNTVYRKRYQDYHRQYYEACMQHSDNSIGS